MMRSLFPTPAALSRVLAVLATACLLAAAPVPAMAQSDPLDTLPVGPRVGAAIPHDLAARDHANQERDFKALARARGLIILFSRSFDW